MQIQWRAYRPGALWLCALLWQPCPALTPPPDPCATLASRGVFCTHTPDRVGAWTFSPVSENWIASVGRHHSSLEALLDAWVKAVRTMFISPKQTCETGSVVNLASLTPMPGSFERNTFPDRLQNGAYQYDVFCTDTSLGHPIRRMLSEVISVRADRSVGCTPPLVETQWPQTGESVCVGESRPVVTLKDLGPVEPGSRISPRAIEATLMNSANGNAPMGDATIPLTVLPPTGPGTAGRLLNTTYPGQHTPATSVHGATDRDGKTVSTFYWPQAAQQAPVQRIGAMCDEAGKCATTLEIRWSPDIVIGFFNGVANTEQAALGSLEALKSEFGTDYKNARLKYDWLYNQTACGSAWYGKLSCLEDVAEVFEQRSEELGGVLANRWETFWDILAGRHANEMSFTGRLLHLLGKGSLALLHWLDATVNALINQLARDTLKLLTLFTEAPTYENRAAHLERLARHADEGSRLLLVAHSQGNLFVNSAYDALKADRPDVLVQVVQVAPASPTLRGAHALADIDLVINALRVTGLGSVPNINVTLPPSSKDVTGHGFEPTYLDHTRAAYGLVRGMIINSMEALDL